MRMKYIWTGLALLLFASLAQAQGGVTRSLTATSGASVACPSTGCLIQQLDGYGSWAVQLTNTFVGTVQFEQSNGGMSADQTTWTWVSLPMTPSAGGAAVTAATAPGVWAGRLGGIRWVRVRVSAYTSGTIDVQTGPSPATIGYIPPFDSNVAHFLDGTGAFSTPASGGSPGGATNTVQYNGGSSTFAGIGLNATATKMYVQQVSSGAPTLNQVDAGDLSGLGTGVATFLGTPTSANFLAALTTKTGTGNAVFATSPTFVTPILGTPTSGTLTNATGLPEGGLNLTDVTTANASTSAHGFLPKLDNNVAHFLNGQGGYTTPSSSGVTSVGLTVPGGSIFGVTGSPVTTSGSIGLTTTGTSGAVPYFFSGSAVGTSALLGQNQFMLGGGSGGSPFTESGFTIEQTGHSMSSSTQPRAVVYNSATQTVAASTTTTLTFDSEDVDVGNMHSTVTNTSRITVPTGAGGFYCAYGSVRIAAFTGTLQAINIALNGTNVRNLSGTPQSTNATDMQVTWCGVLAATDFLELQGFQNSAGNVSFGSVSKALGSTFVAVKFF